mmetsp:Transcript_1061/g.1471  ORF Transcript_1061/g.1471 Transcript_1061/m.1471 type:complete len:272 (+) Transcript_1061:1-816(+)
MTRTRRLSRETRRLATVIIVALFWSEYQQSGYKNILWNKHRASKLFVEAAVEVTEPRKDHQYQSEESSQFHNNDLYSKTKNTLFSHRKQRDYHHKDRYQNHLWTIQSSTYYYVRTHHELEINRSAESSKYVSLLKENGDSRRQLKGKKHKSYSSGRSFSSETQQTHIRSDYSSNGKKGKKHRSFIGKKRNRVYTSPSNKDHTPFYPTVPVLDDSLPPSMSEPPTVMSLPPSSFPTFDTNYNDIPSEPLIPFPPGSCDIQGGKECSRPTRGV